MRKTTARTLAMRDPARAAALGAIDGDDFGVEFGDDIEFGYADAWGAEAAMVPAPTKDQALAAFAQQHQMRARTAKRASLLEPNAGSAKKIERYAMSLSQALTLGTAVAISMSQNPDTNIRPSRAVSNAPQPGFVTLDNIKAANVSALIGGTADAFTFSALAVGTTLDLPTLSPANRLSVTGNYTGFVPPGYVSGVAFTFCMTFTGYASVIA